MTDKEKELQKLRKILLEKIVQNEAKRRGSPPENSSATPNENLQQ